MKGRSLGGRKGRRKGSDKGPRGRRGADATPVQIKVRESIVTCAARAQGRHGRARVHDCRLAVLLSSVAHLSLALDCIKHGRLYWLFHSAKSGQRSPCQFSSSARITIIAALVNAALKYFTGLLALCIRERLTTRAHKLYMERMNYYKANHVGDTLENTDQLICEDIEKFSSAFADVYSQSLKPIVDFVLVSLRWASWAHGCRGSAGMYTWLVVAVAISAKV